MRALVAAACLAAVAVFLLAPRATQHVERAPAAERVVKPDARAMEPSMATFTVAPRQEAAASAPTERLAPPAIRDDARHAAILEAQAAEAHARARHGKSQRASAEAMPARRFLPGSRAHAQAIATALAADEYAQTVEPLARLYFGYFGRAPDYGGLAHYIGEREAGSPLAEIADEFAGSPEFEARFGSLDNAAFVDRLIRNMLGGASDPAQRALWLAHMDSGAITRGELMVQISESAAFRASTAHAVFVVVAYAEALTRAPTAAELRQWMRFLAEGHPRAAVIEALLGSRPRK